MAAARPALGLVSLIVLAGGILLQMLVILSGGVNSYPINLIYFLRANTDGIQPQPRNPTSWTFWALCGVNPGNGRNIDCGEPVPALPFDPKHRTNFGTVTGLPEEFIGTSHYFYLSRFMFAFYLIALLFAAIALATGLLALCSRLGGYISGLNTAIALFFQTISAALMTAWAVQGRDAFRQAGRPANLGVKAFAFTWTAMACFLISSVLFCLSGAANRDRYAGSSRAGGVFGRKRSTRSRGSFIESDGHSRVKDEYA